MRYFALILFGTSCYSLFHGSSKITLIYCYFKCKYMKHIFELLMSSKITLIYCYFKCKYMKHIFELLMKDQIGERSSQLLRSNRRKILAVVTQLKQLRKESLKKKNSGLNGIRTHDLIAPSWLVAQLVEHCTGIAEVMGSNPVQA